MNEHNGSEESLRLPDQRISALEQAGGLVLALGLGAVMGIRRFRRSRRSPWLILSAVCQMAIGLLFWIFRDPQRNPPQEERLILAPADGTILQIARQAEPRFLREPATRIVIQVSLRDPQVNRAPFQGLIGYRRYEIGRASPEAPDDSNWLGISGPAGSKILLRQIASPVWRPVPDFFARRINCWPDLEDEISAGQRIGHLPLGGRVEIYLPAPAKILVEPGQRVLAGQTALAALPSLVP